MQHKRRTWRDFPAAQAFEGVYATEINRVRVILEGESNDENPWLVDGIQVVGGLLLFTEDALRYASVEEALHSGVLEFLSVASERGMRINITPSLVEEDLVSGAAA